jgi:phosphohistidine phosphatase SixA
MNHTKRYATWLNATAIDEHGQPLPENESKDEPDLQAVQQIVAMIRQTRPEVSNIRVSVTHEPTVREIKNSLSEQELNRVLFDVDYYSGNFELDAHGKKAK